MKILHFSFRGTHYQVNEKGHIKANALNDFSPTWIFLGGSTHHWHNSVTIPLHEVFENPGKLNGCLGWDKDHGTIRCWGGSYGGKLPRIKEAYVDEVTS